MTINSCAVCYVTMSVVSNNICSYLAGSCLGIVCTTVVPSVHSPVPPVHVSPQSIRLSHYSHFTDRHTWHESRFMNHVAFCVFVWCSVTGFCCWGVTAISNDFLANLFNIITNIIVSIACVFTFELCLYCMCARCEQWQHLNLADSWSDQVINWSAIQLVCVHVRCV
jgi:hypothetical protein